MDAKERAIVERFLTRFPAMYSLDIAAIVGVDQKDVIKFRREFQDKARASYLGGVILEREFPDEIEDI